MRSSLPWLLLLLTMGLGVPLASCTSDGGAGERDAHAPDAAARDLATPDGAAAGDDGGAEDGADDAGPAYADTFALVEVPPETPAPLRIAVQACAGLYNRALGGSIYTRTDEPDARWLDELTLTPAQVMSASDFLDACLARVGRCVRYDYATQQRLLPSVLTAGAALEAVPVDLGMNAACETVAFDAVIELAEASTPALATQLVADRFLSETTGLAMLNPGYEIQAADLSNPDLTRDMEPDLIDYVFARKLFVVFLVNGCVDASPEKQVLSDLVNRSPWPKPVGVFGYNDSWLIGGYIYEAQTRCLDSRNMGAIPTKTPNLSFFSTRRAPITDPDELQRNEPEAVAYDPDTTYVAFVVGDGDNVRFLMSSRNEWLQQRLDDCRRPDSPCAPLTWSLSPHLPWLAPDVLEWYVAQTRQTGRDFFALPPSGHLYAYPTSLNEPDQERFVQATEADARILGAHSTVHWDWKGTWEKAETQFLPKYARAEGVIRGIIPVNVPFMVPAFPGWEPDTFFRVLQGADGGEVVVFRPRQWRGVDDSGSGPTEPFYINPARMADELGSYPPGTVTAIYMTSDGGLSLENSFLALSRQLPPGVRIVSADAAAQLALDAHHARVARR